MPTIIEKKINEALRDALTQYYLSEVVPADEYLADKLLTANDLYEYLLLDVQVAQEVQTSKVASAIGSIQQYINSIILGMEPGYETRGLEAQTVTEWKDQTSQYPLWASNQQLAWYPEIYIDPSLRLKKSDYFRQLEMDVNQSRIQIDTTQEAVKTYLAKFEEVANLNIVNGYVDSDNFAEGTYYFVGQCPRTKAYYWRSVNMSERAYKAVGGTGPKFDNPSPGAWSDWKKAELPITGNTLHRTIRPVLFNNRLCVTWVDALTLEQDDKPAQLQLSLNMAYKKYDETWSEAQTYIQAQTPLTIAAAGGLPAVNVLDTLDTIAVYEPGASPRTLFISLYAGYVYGGDTDPLKDKYVFIRSATIDRSFVVTPVTFLQAQMASVVDKTAHFMLLARLFAKDNKDRFQFAMPAEEPEFIIEQQATTGDKWNYGNHQSSITDLSKEILTYDKKTSSFTVDSAISNTIDSPNKTLSLLIILWNAKECHNLVLNVPANIEPNRKIKLLKGSSMEVIFSEIMGATLESKLEFEIQNTNSQKSGNLISDAADDNYFFTIPPLSQGSLFSLEGKYIYTNYIIMLRDNPELWERATLTNFIFSKATFNKEEFSKSHITYGNVEFIRQISHPKNIATPQDGETTVLAAGQFKPLIAPPENLSHTFQIDNSTFLPAWADSQSNHFYLVDGVRVRDSEFGSGWTEAGHAGNLTKIIVSRKLAAATPIAPTIGTQANAMLGTAEYINFVGSSIAKSDGSTDNRAPIRMNTLFATELINKANIALENLLSWSTQLLEEPPMPGGPVDNKMDFTGANSLYFWELFLHLPFMIAHRLNLEGQFDQAEAWLSFIFEPGRKAASFTDGRPDYWNVRPLIPAASPPDAAAAITGPQDPDAIASSHPVRYQKAIHAFYVKNQIDRGDAAYRQLSPDSLGEAKLWYMRALNLLGPRPDTHIFSRWEPRTLKAFGTSTSAMLRAFEQRLIKRDQTVSDDIATHGAPTLHFDAHTPLRLQRFSADPTLPELDNPYLRAPLNPKLVGQWDTLDARLHNLRNNRSLDGKPLSLPVFAAPLDPRALLSAHAQGAGGAGAGGLIAQETPHYRFSVMLGRANAAVDTLSQFGSNLLSIIERREQAEFQELDHQQAWDFAHFGIDLQLQAQKVEIESRAALLASQAIAQARAQFYGALVDQYVLPDETLAASKKMQGRNADVLGSVAQAVGSALKLAPNVFGFSNGGHRLEGAAEMTAAFAKSISTMDHSHGTQLDVTAAKQRRAEEWGHQRDQAILEAEHIAAQLRVQDEQAAMTSKQLDQARAALDHAKAKFQFLSKRFTAAQLYQWLSGQFSTFYYQAYDATLSLCLAAEACWQYELGDFVSRFIQPGAWNDAYRGLTAGESLKLNLIKMDAAYLANNPRLLQINKTISVRQLLGKTDPVDSEQEIAWPTFVAGLLADTSGAAQIELNQELFDSDYPGHYLRRIKRMSVSLPVTVGPYQDIRATLTQTYNAVTLAPSIDATKYLRDPDNGINGDVRENLRASQEIALSSGINDDGLFTFDFDDERYLPFEGTGAVSRWSLQFPTRSPADDEERQKIIASLTDVILHVQYTAANGGQAFAEQVNDLHLAPKPAKRKKQKQLP